MAAFSYKNKSILIVDDQRAFHVMLKTMLSNQGAEKITCIDNADTAIRLVQHKKFDIYLIDYNLGSGRNGSQLINYLKENKLAPKNAIFFILTGDNNKEMVLTAIEKSPDDYLIKPFSQKQLFNRLSNAAHKKEMIADIFDALEKNDTPKAIALCKDKIKNHPKYRGVCENVLVDILIDNNQYHAAENLLQKQIEKRLLMRSGINLGKLFYLQAKYPDAITLLKKVIHRSPLQMDAYQWLARSYRKSGNYDDALYILSKAARISHHSIQRHQELALLATEMNEHQIMISSYAAILNLSRRSFYPDPCHLANYVRSIIDYAKEETDLTERKVILKKVNSTLYQSRFEEGKILDFDFNGFDELCQANVLFTLEQKGKAKRKILNTLGKKEGPINEFDNTFLCESTFSLLDIGEFEYATPYLHELKQRDISDPITLATIEKQTGQHLADRINNFKSYNSAGIEAFARHQYEESLTHFNRALHLEPLNSGVLLNRLQAYVEMLKMNIKNKKTEIIEKCNRSFDQLNNTNLPEQHLIRYENLKKEFAQAK